MTEDQDNPDDSKLPESDNPFGDGSSSDESFGMSGFGDEFNSPVEDNEGLDDDDIDSDLTRLDLGIEGLDEMIQGGVPIQSLLVVVGEPGTGKTTFAMQFLEQALDQGENAVYITLEEGRKQVIRSADEKGFEFSSYRDNEQLAVIGYDPIEMKNSLSSIADQLPSMITEFGATRLVIDSVSLLEMMYDGESARRNQIYDFLATLQEAGVTTLLTSEASKEYEHTSRYGLVEYLTDAWIMLRYVRSDTFSQTRMAVEIQKIRDTKHSRIVRPYDLTTGGIEVYKDSSIF